MFEFITNLFWAEPPVENVDTNEIVKTTLDSIIDSVVIEHSRSQEPTQCNSTGKKLVWVYSKPMDNDERLTFIDSKLINTMDIMSMQY